MALIRRTFFYFCSAPRLIHKRCAQAQKLVYKQLNEEAILKEMSIKGRFAFAMRCLELLLDKERDIDKPIVQRILAQLWSYTKSDRLDDWEEEVFAFDPQLQAVDIEEFSSPAKKEIEEIREYYLTASETVRELISAIISIGRDNLYAATIDYSKSTLTPTVRVMNLTQEVVGRIPDVESFRKFAFSDRDGWGISFGREDVS